MKNPHTEVEVPKIPKCWFCKDPAKYDAKTRYGPWAYMCQRHFEEHGKGLGLGKGQKLVGKESSCEE